MCNNIDDLFNQNSEPRTEAFSKAWIEENIAGFKMPESYSSLKDIRNITNNLKSTQKGFADRVIDNLYFYNSKVKIIVKDKYSEVKLLALPEAEVIIDFFHDKKEDFIGNENVKFNDNGELVIAEQYSGYVYYTLHEALLSSQVLKSVCKLDPWRKNEIENGIVVEKVDRKLLQNILSIAFHGNHNWACNTCYFEMKKDLGYNLLPFQVLCYESSSYLRTIDNYYVETNDSLVFEKELKDLDTKAEFALFAYHPIGQDAINFYFYGFFVIDIEKSKEMNHISFKRTQTVWG